MPARRFNQPYRRGFQGRFGNASGRQPFSTVDSLRPNEATLQDEKIEATRLASSIDESMGFARYDSGKKRVGWLCNMHSSTIEDDKIPGGRAGVDFYFIEDDGGTFKATVEYEPYFLVAVKRGREAEVEEWARRKFESMLKGVRRVEKEDLQMVGAKSGFGRFHRWYMADTLPDAAKPLAGLSPSLSAVTIRERDGPVGGTEGDYASRGEEQEADDRHGYICRGGQVGVLDAQ